MTVTEYALFPTRLLAIEFPESGPLNRELAELFEARFHGEFDMHPDSLNLLALADAHPCVARLGEMFRGGLQRWLAAERLRGEFTAEVVLFSNYAGRGDFTLIHNHNADVVGIYYVKTADYGRSPVAVPDPNGDYEYFAAEDGVLVLHDPRFNANLAAVRSTDYAKVFPRPGLMLLFPGYLWHSVTPHLGDFRRLAISANFRLRSPAANAVTWPVRDEG
ncbi:MAG: putative 2OG-Fe(II) oxygenase [Gemmataceae bacterium]